MQTDAKPMQEGVDERIAEVISQFPQEVQTILRKHTPSWDKKTKRWRIVYRGEGGKSKTYLLDKKYDQAALQLYVLRNGRPPEGFPLEGSRQSEKPKQEGSEIKVDTEAVAVPSPEQRATQLLAIQTPPPRVDKEFKPATVLEAERAAWTHNVAESVGEVVYQEALKRVSLTDEDRADYRKAVSKLLSVVTYIDEDTAKQLLRTEAEMIIAYRLAEEWKKRAKQYEEAWNSLSAVLAQTLCPKCRLAILSHYMMGGAH